MIDRTITAADFEKVFFTGREYDAEITEAVASIIDDVRKRGDAAVLECTQRYDGVRLTETRVSVAEIKDARQHTPKDMEAIFAEAIKNVTEYHQYQTPKDWFIEKGDGTRLGRVYRPIERVGLYVPGGTASYPSSVIMNAVPAIVAGVPEIVLVSPPSRETGMVARNTLAVADMLGITEIYAVGGAQAVSALAYGTANHQAGLQDNRSGERLCHRGEAPGLRQGRDRLTRRAERAGGVLRRDGRSRICRMRYACAGRTRSSGVSRGDFNFGRCAAIHIACASSQGSRIKAKGLCGAQPCCRRISGGGGFG